MATLSQEQVEAYLRRISFPKSKLPINPDSLDHLTVLQRYSLAMIPFESLGLHYSKDYIISIALEDVFEKQVTRRRGGYCMENNSLFLAVLRALGFKAYGVGGRVSETTRGSNAPGMFGGWSHQLSIVTIGNTRYMVDVGFGSNGPTQPIPLRHDEPVTTIAPSQCRLEHRHLTQQTDESQRAWVYSFRQDDQSPWAEAYMFVETEFFDADFEVMNLATSLNRQSIFVQKIVVQRMILAEDGNDIVGTFVLFENALKKRVAGITEISQVLTSEDERFTALAKWFGIRLSARERGGIKYLASEIKP